MPEIAIQKVLVKNVTETLPETFSSIAMTEKRKFVQARSPGIILHQSPNPVPQLQLSSEMFTKILSSLTYTAAPAANVVLAGSAHPAATAMLYCSQGDQNRAPWSTLVLL